MGKMIPYTKKVLLATDGTEDSTRAAHAAVALAGDADAELHVVHVGQSTASVYGAEATGGRLPGESTGYAERTARKLLDRQPEQIRAAGVSGTHLRTGRRPRSWPRRSSSGWTCSWWGAVDPAR